MWIDFRRCAGLLLVLGMLLSASSGRAETAAEPDACAAYPPCAALAERGKLALVDGNYEGALWAYRRAYSYYQTSKILYNIARVLHKSGDFAEAIPHYRQYIAQGKQEPKEQLAKAAQLLKELEEEPVPAPLAKDPAPSAAPPNVQPAVDRSPRAARNPTRPWLIAFGVGLLGAGAVVGGFGISGLISNGECKTWSKAYPGSCLERYESQGPSGAMLGSGLIVMLSGALVLAVSTGPRKPALRPWLAQSELVVGK